jgi:hypothetical protein
VSAVVRSFSYHAYCNVAIDGPDIKQLIADQILETLDRTQLRIL